MEYSNTIDMVLNDIKEIESIVQNFKNDDSITQIEIDLVLDKMRRLYDVFLMLNKANTSKKTYSSRKPEFDKISESVPEAKNEADKTIPPSVETVEEIVEQENETTNQETREQEDLIETVSDKYQHTQFQNERLGDKAVKKDVSSKLQSRPIGDIKKAIGVNDKFLYTKELFMSNPSLYSQTIEDLNNAEDFEDAMEYLKLNFDWELDDETVSNFIDIIKRKFTEN